MKCNSNNNKNLKKNVFPSNFFFVFFCNHGTNKTRIYFSYWTEFPFCCHCCRRFAIVGYWLSFETHDDGKKIVMFSCCVLYLFVHGILDERFNEMNERNEWKEHIFATQRWSSARQKGSFPSFFLSYWFDSIYFTIDNINFFSNKAKNLLKKIWVLRWIPRHSERWYRDFVVWTQ